MLSITVEDFCAQAQQLKYTVGEITKSFPRKSKHPIVTEK